MASDNQSSNSILTEYSVWIGFFRNHPFYPFDNISFAASSSLPQRPYMVRFIIFNLLFVPSTKPFDRGLATAFYTADKSFSSWIFLEEALKWKRLNCKRSLKTALDYVISNWVIGEKVYNECEKTITRRKSIQWTI